MKALLVGLGKQGTRLLERLSDRGHHVEVAAPNRYSSWDRYLSYLSDPEWEAVFICSDDDTHAKYATEAFRNGKHVYVEKPVGSSFDETCRILYDCRSYDTIFCTGYMFLWHPFYQELLNPKIDTWHFYWAKPTTSRFLDRTLMSHHLSMAIMAWGQPISNNIVNLEDKSIGQFAFDNGKTMTSVIKRDINTVHEVYALSNQHSYRENLQHYYMDPMDKMLDYFERGVSKLSEHNPTEWSMSLEDLVFEVARVLNG